MGAAPTIPCDVARIERELRHLWKGEAQRSETGEPVMCARTLNLVVFSTAEDEESTIRMLDGITAEHPGRTIVITEVQAEGPELRARVSASCLVSHGGNRYLGRELIAIQAKPSAHDRIPSMLEPLLVPDLPVFLWWRDLGQLQSKLFEKLSSRARRIIVDSAEFATVGDLTQLQNVMKHISPAHAVSDLAWSRLTSWRALTAQFFDGPTRAPYLQSVNRMVVEFALAGRHQFPADALLFTAWFASRLRCVGRHSAKGTAPAWSSEKNTWEFDRKGGTLTVEFQPSHEAGQGMMALQLSAERDATASFTLKRTQAGGLATRTEIAGKPPMRRVLRGKDESLAHGVGGELEILGRDHLYEEVLDFRCGWLAA